MSMMKKEEWRKAMKETLQNMPDDTFQQYCTNIYAKLFKEEVWEKANTIGITLSINREVETRQIIEKAWEMNKLVAVPKSIPQLHELTFYSIQSYRQIEKGYANIMEPNPSISKKVEKNKIDLLFVPGLVFDKNGFRIGYGGGYYDRFLQQFQNETISLAFDCQIVTELPHEEFDLPVNRIISEKKVIVIEGD